MTVAQLIEKLQTQDQSAKVILYSRADEGADWAHGVQESSGSHDESRPYVKGDWPDYGQNNKVVIIR